MTILFMNNSGFSSVTAELNYVSFLKNHFSYEIWDLSSLDNKKGTFKNIDEAQEISSFEEFDARLANIVSRDTVVIVTNMVQAAYYKFYKYIKKYDILVIDTQKNNFMSFLERKSAFVFQIKMPIKTRIKRIMNSCELIRKINKKLKYDGVQFDYFLSAYNFSPEEVKQFIKTHNVKYDEFLKYKKSESIIDKDYILFIDSATYFHPNDYSKIDPNFDPEHHLRQLNDYFSLLETKYNVPVIISLHPCSVGVLNDTSFGGRKTIYSKTPLLIQHAKFVVSFFSTSLINVVLADKPSIIITSKEVENSERKKQESCAFVFAKMCGFIVDSLDKPVLPAPIVDNNKYEKFKRKYLVNYDKKDISNGEMILELIHSLEEKS